jgi:hypothetical protein
MRVSRLLGLGRAFLAMAQDKTSLGSFSLCAGGQDKLHGSIYVNKRYIYDKILIRMSLRIINNFYHLLAHS